MSVECVVCIQERKGCTESKPEADFGFMYGYMFSQTLGLFFTLSQILPGGGSFFLEVINPLAPGALSLAFILSLNFGKPVPSLSQADLS